MAAERGGLGPRPVSPVTCPGRSYRGPRFPDARLRLVTRAYAYLAGGRLHIARTGGPPQVLDSVFAESVRQRHSEIQRRHSWKAEGRGAQWSGLLWGSKPGDAALMRIAITCV